MDQRHAVSELIYRSCTALDDKNFGAYLELCDPAFRYRITAFSPEIRKEMTWLEHDKAGLQTLFNNLPRHNSDKSPLTRHVTVYTVQQDDEARRAKVLSALQVFKTSLDGGRDGAVCGRQDLRRGCADRRRPAPARPQCAARHAHAGYRLPHPLLISPPIS